MKTAAIILIVVGAIMIAYTGFHYVTADPVVDMGSMQITHDTTHYIQWPPFLGATLLLGGIVVLFSLRKKVK
ncbi:MAG TPA: hypothetical protein VL651_06210 [Bacteroidia bacterium]|jgi:hypothetical protein|nr:hypothetical protein [Bacteroidia bacterium]